MSGRPAHRWKILPAAVSLILWAPVPLHAAESGRLVEKDGQYVFVESLDPATKLLLERAVRQGTITQAEYDNVVLESERRAYLMQPSYKLWYDRGFNISLNDNAFLLKIRARFMGRMTSRFRNDAWRNPGDAKNYPELLGVFGDYRASRSDNESTQFNLRRARLYFMGHLFNPDFKYFIQLRGETAENAQAPGSLQLFDWFFTSTHIPLLNAQFGQYKVYFNRAQINSTASMQFAERALVMDAFTASGLDRRDIGITIMNDEELYPVNYYFGVFNGAGPNFNRLGSLTSEQPTEDCPGGQTGGNPFPSPATCTNSSQRNLNANVRMDLSKVMFAGRLMWNIMGRPGYGEGDLIYSETPQMAIGGGYAYNPSINTSSNNAFVGIDLGNLNYRRQLAAFGNGRQLGWGIVDYSTWSLDYVFKYRGFSFQTEYYFKNVIRHDTTAPCLQTTGGVCTAFAPGLLGNAQGWYAQSGYFLLPRKVELAGRYAYWDPDTRAAGDLVKEVNVALTYYVNGTYDHQITLQYSNLEMGTGGYAIGRSNPLPATGPCSAPSNCPSGTVPLDAAGGVLREHSIRLQYQIFF
jgi:hypothetical protein